MNITPTTFINSRINKPSAVQRISMTQPQDVFISFKGAEYNKIEPFLRDGVEYSSRNLKKFNQAMESIDFKNRTDCLVDSLTQTALWKLGKQKEGEDLTFAVDFLLREGNPKSLSELCKRNIDAVLDSLPRIQFSEAVKPNLLSLLNNVAQHCTFDLRIYENAIYNDNVPLLKALVQDTNWLLFRYHSINDPVFERNDLQIIRQGQKSQNPEIRELFNGKNLYNLLNQYQYIYTTVVYDADSMFDLGMVYLYETPDKNKRKDIGNEMVIRILEHGFGNKAELISEIPLSTYELKQLNRAKKGMYASHEDIIKQAINMRIEKIIKRNGVDTPENILSCLNDRLMTPELLEQSYQNFTLIDKITNIPVTEKNKPIISQIVAKLAETEQLPDNTLFRRAGITAAKQGNVELLKLFESRHIHFANYLDEPIDNFPKEVQGILRNAKVNNMDILAFIDYPSYLETYLKEHPNVDINSTDHHGNTLVSHAINSKSLATLKVLATRDDVDWNVTDIDGKTPLMQLLTRTNRNSSDLEYKKQVLEILRELPKGKLNVNYINPNGFESYTGAYTALTEVLFYPDGEYELLDDLLKFPDIDTNLNPQSDMPLCLSCVSDFKTFKKLYEHPNTDISLIKDEHFEKLRNNEHVRFDYQINRYLKEQSDKMFAKWAKNLYEKNGILTVDEIEKFINYENFSDIANTQFNVFGENIAHLLVDIFPSIDNPKELGQIAQIVRKLKENNFDFNLKDELDRTPLDKAIEAENNIIADLLRRYQ